MAVAEKKPSCLQWIICFLDVVCKAVTTDMDAWSAFAVGPNLSSAKIALFGGGGGVFRVRRHHSTAQKFFVWWERHQPVSNSFLDSG